VPTEDEFAQDDPLPLFLSARADEHVRRESSLLRNAGILFATATLIGIAITLSWGNSVKVFTEIKASPAGRSAPKPDIAQSTTPVQSSTDARELLPSSNGAPRRDEVPAAPGDADQKRDEVSKASSGVLLQQFQAWAAKQDERARAEPARRIQDARAGVSQEVRAPVKPVQKHRRIRPVQNARAEMRPSSHPRARVRQDRNAPVELRPAQDVRAQAQPVENAQAPSFLQGFGWRQ
jgi:hypothetical protein